MFTDMVGYSALVQRNETLALELLDEHRALLRAAFAEHGGREIEAVGDGFFVEFSSTLSAARCAVTIQQRLAERNGAAAGRLPIQIRIGLHVGDVVARDNRVHGDAVNIAARIEPIAPPGGICVSEDVARQIQNKIDLPLIKLGKGELKNIRLPVDIYRIVLTGEPPVASLSERVAFAFRRQRTRRAVATGAALVVILAVAGALVWQVMRSRAAVEDPVLALPKGPSIAVLPFSNLSGDPKQDYFADGISEQIITGLARFRSLFVIARNSTFRYKGKAVDVRQVGKELGARYVLEGSVQRARDRVRVTAQLLDASTGAHLWAETYDRALTASNLFSVQDDITERVVGALTGVYGPMSHAAFEQSKGKATESLDAYECVLLYFAFMRAGTPSTHLRARDCLERAVKLAPTYPDAWATLARTYATEHADGFNPRLDPLGRALQAARKAVELDPTSQSAHMALGQAFFFSHDIAAFEAEAARVLALNPNNADALAWYGWLWTFAHYGDPAQRARGVAVMKKAIALDPMHPPWYYFPITYDHYFSGRLEAALAEARKIDIPGYFWSHATLAIVYGAMNRKVDAQPAVAKLLELYPEFPRHVRRESAKWNVTPAQIEQMVSDLRKAGLEIPPQNTD